MDHLTLNAYAKINLSLDVLGLRDDGFHQVEMVMQSISLADKLRFERASDLCLTCNDPTLPTDTNNLVLKAARILKNRYKVSQGARIYLEKNIPVAAGLGGGSSDGAMTLWGLNILWDLRLSAGELLNIAGELGSDVPFALIGGTIFAQGRGEKLTTLPPLPRLWLVLVKPSVAVSTKEIYKKWDELAVSAQVSQTYTPKLVQALENGQGDLAWKFFGNHLEEVTTRLYPEVKKIKEKLLENGAKRAVMSGSGPTVYGIMEGKEAALKVQRQLKKHYAHVYVAHTL